MSVLLGIVGLFANNSLKMSVFFDVSSRKVCSMFASNSLKMPVFFDVSSGKLCCIV